MQLRRGEIEKMLSGHSLTYEDDCQREIKGNKPLLATNKLLGGQF